MTIKIRFTTGHKKGCEVFHEYYFPTVFDFDYFCGLDGLEKNNYIHEKIKLIDKYELVDVYIQKRRVG